MKFVQVPLHWLESEDAYNEDMGITTPTGFEISRTKEAELADISGE